MQDLQSIVPYDSVLMSINIDRSLPGTNDTIQLKIDTNSNPLELKFTDVYEAQLHLNFGIVAQESIREVRVDKDDSILQQLMSKWAKIGVDISDLKCFVFVTNSTNSTLKIFARDFEIGKT